MDYQRRLKFWMGRIVKCNGFACHNDDLSPQRTNCDWTGGCRQQLTGKTGFDDHSQLLLRIIIIIIRFLSIYTTNDEVGYVLIY